MQICSEVINTGLPMHLKHLLQLSVWQRTEAPCLELFGGCYDAQRRRLFFSFLFSSVLCFSFLSFFLWWRATIWRY